MNYLAHLHLGGHSPQQLLGSLYGDFVKGPLPGRFAPDLEAAIRLHRQIDTYTDGHPRVLAAVRLFPPGHRRYAGIITDVFFDHVLALHWHRYHSQPLEQFTAQVYHALGEAPELPGQLAFIAPHMIAEDWLGAYRDFQVLERVLNGIARRLSRPAGLAGAFVELQGLYEPLSEIFHAFYPELQAFAASH